MAILDTGWIGGRRWEVRGAGATRRLLVDGVLHTAWNPRRAVTGAVWDPLALSAFLAEPGSVRRVLLLGLGGGAAVHLLRRHVRPRRIVAVEREAAIAVLAEQWFGVAGPDVEIVTADAIRWARRNRERFDLVIDDIFGEHSGEPLRAAGGVRWWRGLAARVTAGGVLVVNFTEGGDAPKSPLARDPWFARRFPSAVRFTFPGYTNAVVALGPAGPDGRPLGPAALLSRIRASPGFTDSGERRLLRLRASPLRSPRQRLDRPLLRSRRRAKTPGPSKRTKETSE